MPWQDALTCLTLCTNWTQMHVLRSVKKLTRSIRGQQKTSITASWCFQASSHAWSLPNCCFIKTVIPTGCDRSIKQDRFSTSEHSEYFHLFLSAFFLFSLASEFQLHFHTRDKCVLSGCTFYTHFDQHNNRQVYAESFYFTHTHTLKCSVCICLTVGEVHGPQGTNSRSLLWGQG